MVRFIQFFSLWWISLHVSSLLSNHNHCSHHNGPISFCLDTLVSYVLNLWATSPAYRLDWFLPSFAHFFLCGLTQRPILSFILLW